MKELGITKDECFVKGNSIYITSNLIEYSGDLMIASCHNINHKSKKANANLIADAFNTANKCGLLPSELLEINKEFLGALKRAIELKGLWSPRITVEDIEHESEASDLYWLLVRFENLIGVNEKALNKTK